MSVESAVAIVGMACRFPGATDTGRFWAGLRGGVDAISRFGRDELVAAGVDPALARRADYVAARGLLPGADRFGWAFFGYSPAEAAMIDPQQRVFLECASEAVDDAGIDPGRFPGWIGVFAGSDPVPLRLDEDTDVMAQVLGQDKDYLATRVAYKLGLRGPAITVQTACSTALTAVHTACQSLLGYECDAALAGGVSASLPQQRGYLHQEGGILSRDGHCRPFDADAGGTVASQGVGVVVLKRLADAQRDGDRIVAVLRGSAVNNDGGDKIGYTAPSVTGQREVIRLALEQAEVDPADLGYVEAHGTATPIGDPVEVEALTAAFRESTDKRGYCLLGSVKGNIGHTGAAAGIAGLIKTALMLERGEFVPTVHFRRPNPLLGLETTPFRISERHQGWTGPRLAGVSSFGIGGTNVHAVLQGPPASERAAERAGPRLLCLSGKTTAGLAKMKSAMADRLESEVHTRLDDVALTLATGRRRFGRRVAVVAETPAEAARLLRAEQAPASGSAAPRVAFLFPGQGTLRHDAGAAAYRLLPAFRADFDEIADEVRRGHGVDLSPVVSGTAAPGWFADTVHQQLGLFALGHGLARQLGEWGVTPAAMLGNSIGEYVAATVAGVWSLPDALALVHLRARAMRDTAPGRMLAVGAPAEAVADRIGPDIHVAVDGPGTVVLSGDQAAVAALLAGDTLAGFDVREVEGERAFHSPLMRPAAETLREAVAATGGREPALRVVSNLTGEWAEPGSFGDPEYWARHLLNPVRLGAGAGTLLTGACDVFAELGPGGSLTSALRRHREWDPARLAVPLLGKDTGPAGTTLLRALGGLWERGLDLPIEELLAGDRPHLCALPPHPFEPTVPIGRTPRARPVTASPGGVTSDAWAQVLSAGQGRHDVVAVLEDGRLPGTGELLAALTVPGAVVHRGRDFQELLEGTAKLPVALVVVSGELNATSVDRLDSLADRAADAGVRLVVAGRGFADTLGTEELVAGAPLLDCWQAARGSRPGEISVLDLGTGPVTTVPDAPGLYAWRGDRWWIRTAQQVRVPEQREHTGNARVTVVTAGRDDGVRMAGALAAAGTRVVAYSGEDVDVSPLPLAEELPKALELARRNDSTSEPLSRRPDLRARLDLFCAGLLGRYALEFGNVEPGATLSADELKARLDPSGILPRFAGFMARTLAEQGWAVPGADGVRVEPRLAELVGEALLAGQGLDELDGLRRILDHCARSYPAVFSGEQDRVSVLYPDGEPMLFRDSLTANVVNPSGDVVVCIDTLRRAVRATGERAADRPLRILEIGAGQGELTWPLLEGWAERHPVEYVFTDISPLMLRRAARRAEELGLDGMSFSLFDLTREPGEQGLVGGSFDLVVAYNAVHVAPRVSEVLDNLGSLLRPGGSLCFIEMVGVARWAHLLWGLTPGWWDFGEDRQDAIMLDIPAWTRKLAESGYADVEAFRAGPESDHVVLLGSIPAATGLEPAERVATQLRRAGGGSVLYLPSVRDEEPGKLWNEIIGLPGVRDSFVVTESSPGGNDWRTEAWRRELDPPGVPPAWRHVRVDILGPGELAELPRILTAQRLPGVLRLAPVAPRTPEVRRDETPLEPAATPAKAVGDDPLRRVLAELWCDVLGVPAVADEDNFFALGGESLMAVHFMGRIRTRAGVHVAPATFTRSPTFGQLLELARRAAPDEANATTLAEAEPDLVVLAEGGTGTPLFLAAPAAGTTLSYQKLANLLDDGRPVFGIEPVQSAESVVRVEDIAAHHVEVIRRVRPHGPYALGGWSFGAVVAHEIARRLLVAGEEVELLVCIDGYVPNTRGRPIRSLRGFLAIGLWYQATAALRLGAAGALVRGAPDVRRVFNANIHAMWSYRPAPVDCAAVVLKTRLDRFRAGWLRRSLAPLYGRGAEVRPVGGQHWTLLDEPHVRQIADEVRRSLARTKKGQKK